MQESLHKKPQTKNKNKGAGRGADERRLVPILIEFGSMLACNKLGLGAPKTGQCV